MVRILASTRLGVGLRLLRDTVAPALVLVFFVLHFSVEPARAELDSSVFGVTTDGKLIRFEHSLPGILTSSVAITGLQPGESLVGIDFRPSNGFLYGIGSSSRVYRIFPDSGDATPINGSAFATVLSGTTFGVDFNPTSERIRVVSNSGQSLRINADTGDLAAVDTALAYGANDPQFGVSPQVTSVAYTNNRAGVTVTTLFGIDAALGNLVRIGGPNSSPSPNGGVLTSLGSLGLGTPLTNVGFDISPTKSPSGVLALAALTLPGETTSKLYSIDIGGGTATLIGPIGSQSPVVDIAISPKDLVTPQVIVSGQQRIRLRDLRSSGVTIQVGCSEACTANGALSIPSALAKKLKLNNLGPATVGLGMLALADAGNATMTITLDAAASAAFSSSKGRRLKQADLSVVVNFEDAANNFNTASLAITAVK